MRSFLIALGLLLSSHAHAQTSINLQTLWQTSVRGQNALSRANYATNANTDRPSGFDTFLDETNKPTGQPAAWFWHRITTHAINNNASLFKWELAAHPQTGAAFERVYNEQTTSYLVWSRIHSNRWFNVDETITPTTNGILSYNGTAWTNRTPAILYTNITAATYTLLESDNGKLLTFANACTLTLPPGLSNGFNCLIEQTGTGNVTWALGSGVTQNRYPASATKVAAQYGRATIEHRSGNLFYINGQIN